MIDKQSTKYDSSSYISSLRHPTFSALPWSAILAGVFVSIGLSFLFNLFETGLGLSAFTTNSDGLTTLAVTGFATLIISVFASLYVSGWIVGFLSRPNNDSTMMAVLYGFIMWSIALMLTLSFLSFVGGLFTTSSALSYSVMTNTSMTDSAEPATNTNFKNMLSSDNPTKVANRVGQTTLVAFAAFLTGAIASCLGAYVGMGDKDKPVRQ